ncbi:MAG: hypothetical protein RLW61_01065 [Gammaproteobacteria bacterium]
MLAAACLLACVAANADDRNEPAAHASARCTRAATLTHEINISSGVNNEQVRVNSPLHVTIPAGTDATAYQDCLRREGFPPRRTLLASFERADGCRAEARGTIRLRMVDGVGSVAQPFDEARYRDCLDGGIEVEIVRTRR